MLSHLAYVSSATEPFSRESLLQLLEHSRRNNAACGITGMLLYRGGNFMQVIEGEKTVVQQLHSRILRDPRHGGCITLLQGPIEARAFPEWSMGFRDLSLTDVEAPPGFDGFLNHTWSLAELQAVPGRAIQLLHSFRQGMR